MQGASDGALLCSSFIRQPDASLPHVAVRGAERIDCKGNKPFISLSRDFFVFAVVAMDAQPDKQAQESVTACYIRCDAAEPHD